MECCPPRQSSFHLGGHACALPPEQRRERPFRADPEDPVRYSSLCVLLQLPYLLPVVIIVVVTAAVAVAGSSARHNPRDPHGPPSRLGPQRASGHLPWRTPRSAMR